LSIFNFKAAERLLRQPEELSQMLGKALKKAFEKRSVLVNVYKDFLTLFRLVKSWVTGEYRETPKKVILWAVLAILYFLSPLDAIPDIFPGGYLDDIAVIHFIVGRIKTDLDRFRVWESAKSKS
jgi:uncharacterized membrane protein YkvA (DUF1232 family)